MPYCGRCGIRYDAENPRVGLAHCKWCQEELSLSTEVARLRADGAIISTEILESEL